MHYILCSMLPKIIDNKIPKYSWETLSIGDTVICSNATLLFNQDKHPYLKINVDP